MKEALSYYKSIRGDIKEALPYWPLGISAYKDPWVSLGLTVPGKDIVAVWRRNSQFPVTTIPVKHLKGRDVKVICGYPQESDCTWKWNKEAGELTVSLPAPVSARVFQLTYI